MRLLKRPEKPVGAGWVLYLGPLLLAEMCSDKVHLRMLAAPPIHLLRNRRQRRHPAPPGGLAHAAGLNADVAPAVALGA